ncbi:MAG TPA: 4Fe-4S dicluster domain-containing protein [Kofleriaceae bacterium]|nr:4Fe-4S dicluster domain-containing protein [Kofleriaceae bacterium]
MTDDRTVGFFTDTTLCIGCKACEVACKEWNQLPDDGFRWTAMSYDNTAALGASTWRHVTFAERPDGTGGIAWKMMSDVCKHCERAGCLEACPTGAIVRTEHGSVYVQPDVCNGCGYCVPACPFGVIARRDDDGRAFKCTLCYDRLQGGLEPACAKACPTDSIQFGPLDELRRRAADRVTALGERGLPAQLYGAGAADQPGTGGLHAFFLLTDAPEVYNLPPAPTVPTIGAGRSWLSAAAGAIGLLALAATTLRMERAR